MGPDKSIQPYLPYDLTLVDAVVNGEAQPDPSLPVFQKGSLENQAARYQTWSNGERDQAVITKATNDSRRQAHDLHDARVRALGGGIVYPTPAPGSYTKG